MIDQGGSSRLGSATARSEASDRSGPGETSGEAIDHSSRPRSLASRRRCASSSIFGTGTDSPVPSISRGLEARVRLGPRGAPEIRAHLTWPSGRSLAARPARRGSEDPRLDPSMIAGPASSGDRRPDGSRFLWPGWPASLFLKGQSSPRPRNCPMQRGRSSSASRSSRHAHRARPAPRPRRSAALKLARGLRRIAPGSAIYRARSRREDLAMPLL